MNNSTVDTDTLLLKINREKTGLLLPAIIYVSVLMVTGLLGNLMVCYFYYFKMRTTPSTVFIVALGLYDLTVCCIFMPTEIADLVKFYTFDNSAACKVLRFVNFFTGVGSILTLLAIAVDRYKHIHKVNGQQITLQGTKLICVSVAAAAVFLSWPSLLIYDALPIDVPNKFGVNLNGSNCMLTNQLAYRPYVWAFYAVQFLCFAIFTTILVVLYGIIGRTIYRHRKRMSRYKSSASVTARNEQENSVATDSVATEFSCSSVAVDVPMEISDNISDSLSSRGSKGTERDITNGNNQPEADQTGSPCYHDDQIEVVQSSDSHQLNNVPIQTDILHEQTTPQMRKNRQNVSSRSKGQGRNTIYVDRETVQITMVMIAVTVLFILSLLPYLCLTIWRTYEGKHEAEFLSDAGLVAFKIVSRSYLLNSSLNPWIYGIFNSRFRLFYYNKFCCQDPR